MERVNPEGSDTACCSKNPQIWALALMSEFVAPPVATKSNPKNLLASENYLKRFTLRHRRSIRRYSFGT